MSVFNYLFLFTYLISLSSSLVEEGYKTFDFDLPEKDGDGLVYKNFTKSMYKGSQISFTIDCDSGKDENERFKLNVILYSQQCQEKSAVITEPDHIHSLDLPCHQKVIIDKAQLNKIVVTKPTPGPSIDTKTSGNNSGEKSVSEQGSKNGGETVDGPTDTSSNPVDADANKSRRRRDTEKIFKKITGDELQKPNALKGGSEVSGGVEKAESANMKKKEVEKKKKEIVGVNKVPRTKYKAIYTLKLGFTSSHKMHFHVKIESKHKGSYLSAINWPLLPFFGVMSLVYLAFAIGWFISSCCNWRDLLRVQFWIGGVIALGMFENALFYTEYRNISASGTENGLLYFAEIVSCVKRALARILVVIVSLGFGIVKPRLGETLHKVLAVGGLYFLLAAIEGCIRVHDSEKLVSKTQMYALVPLTALDVALCWWVFTALVQTTRTLRIRKNIIKLTLYRHFTNTLIFAVVASLAYMIWIIKQSKFTDCIDISTLWMNDALWPFLFAIILLVIMVLWRPSINNQRYAFTPLDTRDSDEDDDMTLSEAFEGMKMRNTSDSLTNGTTKNRKADDDLRWVEENIPSVPSTLLPTIDSDEEIIMTKFETSKMD